VRGPHFSNPQTTAVYPLVRTGGSQVLVRILPVSRSASLHVRTLLQPLMFGLVLTIII